jgi:hypothetical protein
MNPFYIFILVFALVSIGVYYYRRWKDNQDALAKITWPENISECPDYWMKDTTGNCVDIKNVRYPSRGATNCPRSINFNEPIYTGENGNYQKCLKARYCGFSWEGIDNLCTDSAAGRIEP